MLYILKDMSSWIIHLKEAMSELQISRERLSNMMKLYKTDALKRTDLESYIKNGKLASDKLYERLKVLCDESHQLLDGEVFHVMTLAKGKTTSEILTQACKLAMVENSNRLVEIETNIDSQLPNVPSASYLTYIMLQLISNCLYHAFDSIGIGKIKIQATGSIDKLILEISDNGMGMNEHDLSNAFEPFYTTKSDHGRLGIGLGNIKQIVEDVFEGDVELTSSNNEGTRVFIEIPTAEATYE